MTQQQPPILAQLVFHGTQEANVESILKQGLDPNKRKGQAHGRGEYFAEVRGEGSWPVCTRCGE